MVNFLIKQQKMHTEQNPKQSSNSLEANRFKITKLPQCTWLSNDALLQTVKLNQNDDVSQLGQHKIGNNKIENSSISFKTVFCEVQNKNLVFKQLRNQINIYHDPQQRKVFAVHLSGRSAEVLADGIVPLLNITIDPTELENQLKFVVMTLEDLVESYEFLATKQYPKL